MPDTTKRRIGFFGRMRARNSAKITIMDAGRGGRRIIIKHAVLRRMKAKQLVWWFAHIDTTTTFNGKDFGGYELPVYHLWHPHDHIKVRWSKKRMAEDGRILPGSVLHIRERFGGADINARAVVSRFDDKEFNFYLMLGPVRIGELVHAYTDVKGGVAFVSDLTLRCDIAVVGRLITWLATRFMFTEHVLQAWIVHNIEETGESEHFIPQLYAHATKG